MFPAGKRTILLFLCAFICASSGFAQTLTRKQRTQFIKDSIYIMRVKLVRPQFRLDNRNLFFKGQALNVSGVDAGVLLKNKLRVTLGYYALSNSLKSYEKVIDGVTYERQLKLSYGSFNTEIIYRNMRYLSLGMPLEFGFGNNSLKMVNKETSEVYSQESGFIAISDFGLSATFKPIRWIGLKGIIGYRKTLYNHVKDFRFDGLFTSIGLNVDIREIVKDVQMFRLKRKYKRGNSVENAVDLITD